MVFYGICPFKGHIIIGMGKEFIIWEKERCLILPLESRARYLCHPLPARFPLEVCFSPGKLVGLWDLLAIKT
jgi:hypothetical protein